MPIRSLSFDDELTEEQRLERARRGFTVVPNLPEEPPVRPNVIIPPGGMNRSVVNEAVTGGGFITKGPGGFVFAGERAMIVPPTGPTQTNFPTGREIPLQTPPQPVAEAAPAPPGTIPAPAVPLPAPEDRVTALTTDAELAEMTRPKLDPMTSFALGVAAKGGDTVAQREARRKRQAAGITALTNESAAVQQMKAQMAARPGGLQGFSPAERRSIEQDQTREFVALRQARDLKYEQEKEIYDEDLRQAELGIKQLTVAEKVLDIQKKQAEIAAQPATAATEKQLKELEIEKRELEIEKAKRELEVFAPLTDQVPRSSSQVITAIETAKTARDIKATYRELRTALTELDIDQAAINGITLAIMAASYGNPVELAVDIGAEYTPVYSVNQQNIKSVQEEINDALKRQRPPDDAAKEILAANPERAKDNQFILDVSAGVLGAYNKTGPEQLKSIQTELAAKRNQAAQDLSAQFPALQNMTPQSIIAEDAAALNRFKLKISRLAGITPAARENLMLQAQNMFGVPVAGMEKDKDAIQTALLVQLALKNEGNPAMLDLLTETRRRIETNTDRHLIPQFLQQHLDAYAATFAPLAVSAQAEIAKKRRDIETENTKKGLVTRFADDNSATVVFTAPIGPTGDQLIQKYDAAPSSADKTQMIRNIQVASKQHAIKDREAEEDIGALERGALPDYTVRSVMPAGGEEFDAWPITIREPKDTITPTTESEWTGPEGLLHRLNNTYSKRLYPDIYEKVMDAFNKAHDKWEQDQDAKIAGMEPERLTAADRVVLSKFRKKFGDPDDMGIFPSESSRAWRAVREQLKASQKGGEKPFPLKTALEDPEKVADELEAAEQKVGVTPAGAETPPIAGEKPWKSKTKPFRGAKPHPNNPDQWVVKGDDFKWHVVLDPIMDATGTRTTGWREGPEVTIKVEVGDIVDGFRFKGGDPKNRNSWEKTQ